MVIFYWYKHMDKLVQQLNELKYEYKMSKWGGEGGKGNIYIYMTIILN